MRWLKLINESWHPHDFRQMLKRAELSEERLKCFQAILFRIRLIIEIGPDLEAKIALRDLADDVETKISAIDNISFEKPKKEMRILTGKSPKISDYDLTKKVFVEAGGSYVETANRLGISIGLVAQRVRSSLYD